MLIRVTSLTRSSFRFTFRIDCSYWQLHCRSCTLCNSLSNLFSWQHLGRISFLGYTRKWACCHYLGNTCAGMCSGIPVVRTQNDIPSVVDTCLYDTYSKMQNQYLLKMFIQTEACLLFFLCTNFEWPPSAVVRAVSFCRVQRCKSRSYSAPCATCSVFGPYSCLGINENENVLGTLSDS